MTRRLAAAAAFAGAVCLPLAGCASSDPEPAAPQSVPEQDTDQQDTRGDADAPTDGGISGDGDDGILASPAEAAVAYYRRIGAQEFAAACQILAPAVQQALLRQGDDCATVVADTYGAPDSRPYYLVATVDEAQVETAGDVATVLEDAFTSPWLPFETEPNPGSGELQEINPFSSLDLTRLGESWYVVED